MARRRTSGGPRPGSIAGWRLLDLDPAGVVVVAGLLVLFVVAAGYLAFRSDDCDPAAGDCGEPVVGTAPGPAVATTLPVTEELAAEPDAGVILPAPVPTGDPASAGVPAPSTSEPSGGEVTSTAPSTSSTTRPPPTTGATLPGFVPQTTAPGTTARGPVTAPTTAPPTTPVPTTPPPTTVAPTTAPPPPPPPTTSAPPTTVAPTTAPPPPPPTSAAPEEEPDDGDDDLHGVLERLGPGVDPEELSRGLQRQLERRQD